MCFSTSFAFYSAFLPLNPVILNAGIIGQGEAGSLPSELGQMKLPERPHEQPEGMWHWLSYPLIQISLLFDKQFVQFS
jgi:hypothetical protein